MSRVILVIGGVAAILCILFLLDWPRVWGVPKANESMPIKNERRTRTQAVLSPRPSMRESPPVTTESKSTEYEQIKTARSVLSEYWGDQWEGIEAALVSAGIDLSKPFEFVPWEVAEPKLAALIPLGENRWTAAVDHLIGWHTKTWEMSEANWIKDRYHNAGAVTEDDIREIHRICDPYNDELRMIGELRADQISSHLMARWRSGDFIKAPLASYGVPREMGFYSSSHAVAGWSIVLTLRDEDCPDIMDTENRGAKLKELRDEEVVYYFAQTGRR